MEYGVDKQTRHRDRRRRRPTSASASSASVKTKNAISADFHVHSGRSFDTDAAAARPRGRRSRREGVEVMVSTDHDQHIDYAPLITAFGLGSRMTSIVGNEITGSVPTPPAFPNSFGHINAWPLPLDHDRQA